jgi:hypothetical protein
LGGKFETYFIFTTTNNPTREIQSAPFSLHIFFSHKFDLQSSQLPPLSSTHPFKESLLVPQPCPQGDLNLGQYILAKKVMKKIKFRLKLYQLSYAAILHNVAIYAFFQNPLNKF